MTNLPVMEKFGVRILGHYPKVFYDRLTRYAPSPNGKKKEWYISCPQAGCKNDFRLDSYISRARKQRVCGDCRYPKFNGIQLRGPIRRYAKHIARVSRGKPGYGPFWTLSCKTDGCDGTVSLVNVQRTKIRVCAECNRESGKNKNCSIFVKWRRYITRKDYYEGKKKIRRYWARCAEAGCDEEFVFHAWHGKPTTKCPQHRFFGELFGVAVRSRVIWQIRQYIVRVEALEGGGHKWFRRCQKNGCKTVRQFVGLRQRFCRRHELGGKDYERTFNQCRRTARENRGIAWSLSYKDFVALRTDTNCYYCGRLLDAKPFARRGGGTGSGLDRRDSDKGYNKNNCVPCCGGCNIIKGAYLDWREMLVVGLMRQGKMRAAQKLVRETLTGTDPYKPKPVTRKMGGKIVVL